jgi:hypothetical protein
MKDVNTPLSGDELDNGLNLILFVRERTVKRAVDNLPLNDNLLGRQQYGPCD